MYCVCGGGGDISSKWPHAAAAPSPSFAQASMGDTVLLLPEPGQPFYMNKRHFFHLVIWGPGFTNDCLGKVTTYSNYEIL